MLNVIITMRATLSLTMQVLSYIMVYFPQFREVRDNNKPNGPMKGFIEKHFGTYEVFQKEVEFKAMAIEGSGWVYLATDGKIKTIEEHEVRDDILLLIDWWEHAFILDYGSDKKKYL